ncbi:3'-5' RNA helicase YTHDC2-like isoform X1 [Homalodisca vitripennis]|uniref:3'-5' RNA helicase YTHDC2-like isoform X1 n=2 Tax=Homalodisca vitripennis TaxID=197043 RepID=UPI001EECB4D4|nr:3'-5' RNA helicase YTHDC2-like isoform X1 [Homalodisca vitripennis]
MSLMFVSISFLQPCSVSITRYGLRLSNRTLSLSILFDILSIFDVKDCLLCLSFLMLNCCSEDFLKNNQHSTTGVTALMAASAVYKYEVVEDLVHKHAPSIEIVCKDNKTALDYACHSEEKSGLLEAYHKTEEIHEKENNQADNLEEGQVTISSTDLKRLEQYEKYFEKLLDVIDYHLTVKLLLHIHLNEPEGAILVFLPGFEHISAVQCELSKLLSDSENRKIAIHFLHSQMQTTEQKKAFVPAPPGIRKIILSTNIAETSITITDIKYVVDTGKFKEKSFNPENGVHSLQCEWVSKASARQRRGRAGRVQNGTCYRLFSRRLFQQMKEYETPEILREPLDEICLNATQLIPSGMKMSEFFSRAIDPPKQESVTNAIECLKMMKAINDNEQLTPLGKQMIKVPLEPQCSKIILYGVMLKCLEPALILACCISQGDLFKIPAGQLLKQRAASCKKQFINKGYSDDLISIKIFETLQKATEKSSFFNPFKWCFDNFISCDKVNKIIQMKEQILSHLTNNGWVNEKDDLNQYSKRWAVVKAALTSGLYPNVARINIPTRQIQTPYLSSAIVHSKSVLINKLSKKSIVKGETVPSSWMVYGEALRVGNSVCLYENTLVSPLTMCLCVGSTPKNGSAHIVIRDGGDGHLTCVPADTEVELHFDSLVIIRTDIELAVLITDLRRKWDAVVERRLLDPRRRLNKEENAILQTVVNVLVDQDKILNLDQQLFLKPGLSLTRLNCGRGRHSNN